MSEAHSTTNVSYWVQSTSPQQYPRLLDDIEVDVAIAGAGIVGLTAAKVLKEAGLTVAVLEMDRIGRGVTGYTTAKVTSGHSTIYQKLEQKHGSEKAAAYARANQSALEQIARWVAEGSIDCDFERRPNFVYSESDSELGSIKKEVEAAARAGLDVSFESDLDLPFKVAGAVRLEDQAQFHPRKYLEHFAAGVPGNGSHLFEQTRVTHIGEGSRCEVETSDGRVLAKHVVIATHYPFWDRGLFFPRMHPKRSYAVAGPIDGTAPTGMYISVDGRTRSVRTIRDGDRTLLLVGGNGHPVGQKYDTENEYRDLERWMSERFGIDEVTQRWSSHDGVTVDLIPYAGTARRGTERVFTATGFGKWGFTNGTAAALLISDQILGRDNEFASLFDPHRITPRASAEKLTVENSKVAAHWFGDRVKHPQHGSFEKLAPGQAAVEGAGVGQVAGYRDGDGRLHTVSAVCPHLGCIVTWNGAEKSWDCPCHGSRFDYEGRLLHGPAVDDLEKK
ncbi:MAG: FAD-dependent oxidoreductase [Actinomycetota bacterium]|nr:FAD-dependent oxidoreductase [Actinomycetota bacterium]